jgi:hypothetical protein
MATIIHPPDPWGGPRFALDVFSSLISAWDRYQALQERKETRDLLNQQHALRMLEMVLGFPDEHLRANAERVNLIGEQAGLGRIVTETGQIVRPTSMEVQQQQLKTLAEIQEIVQQRIKEDPFFAKAAAGAAVGVTPRHLLEQKYGATKEELGIMKEAQEIEQQRELHPIRKRQLETEIETGKARVPYLWAQTKEAEARAELLKAQKDLVVSGGGVKVGNLNIHKGTWRDRKTGKLQTGIVVVDPTTGMPVGAYAVDKMQRIKDDGTIEEVPVESPEVQKEMEKIKQDVGKAWSRYVKDVLKGRDLDWTDQKEVKRFQDYLQASGFITRMEKIQVGKRTIYSINIIDPSDPKLERPIHGFPSEATEVMRTGAGLTQALEELNKVFGAGGQ